MKHSPEQDIWILPLLKVEWYDGSSITCVPICHKQLDSVVGQLMQMCDLIGDVEQRKALKDTIKKICRDWLDQNYESAHSDRWGIPKNTARIIEIPA